MIALRRTFPWSPREIVLRSLFPIVAVALLLLVPLVGPFALLAAVFVWWRCVTWFA